MKTFTSIFLFLIAAAGFSQIKVDDYYQSSDGKNWSPAIQRAMNALDSLGHGSLEFTGTKNYYVTSSIELPRYGKGGRKIFVLNGNGCSINTTDSISIFNRVPGNQKEALDKMMSLRFTINDFTIVGGKKGINIGATYGTSINHCNFINQTQSAIDIQFGLNTSIFQCNSTGACKNHFVLRTGSDWGGNAINSQSNHSVIDMCRVYAGKGGNSAFMVLGSSGCVIRDCISEGSHEISYSIYFDYAKSTCVRLFKVENLHLEHAPQKAGIYIHNTGIAVLDGIFYQMGHKGEDFALVKAIEKCDQITLKNVPWFVPGTVLEQFGGNDGACWLIEDCSKEFYDEKNWRIHFGEEVKTKLPYYFSGRGYRYQLNKEFKGGK
ncbi:MAG TPA: hypothetical protein VK177_14465 [Flavobacteriales bacterium]|nr:hypothetical protein [Flavobacteriales bacterium]